MFEHHHEPLVSRAAFLRRMTKYALLASGFIVVSLLIGMAGYHHFEGMSWIDAFANSAMLIGGMGPVSDCTRTRQVIRRFLCALLRSDRHHRDWHCGRPAAPPHPASFSSRRRGRQD